MEKVKADAEAGSTVAQGVLGISYLYGLDTPKDFAIALHWLTLAAERGASRPTFHLGRMYEQGWGVSVDYKRAGQLYQTAADRGEWLSYIHLARLYRYGRGTELNLQAAIEWYEYAVSESERVEPCPELEEAREYVESHLRSWSQPGCVSGRADCAPLRGQWLRATGLAVRQQQALQFEHQRKEHKKGVAALKTDG